MGTTENLLVWYNNKGDHALPSYINSMHNAMLRTMVAEGTDDEDPADFGITTFVHPLPITRGQINAAMVKQTIADFGIALLLLISFSFVPASLISYLITERVKEEKRVQLVAGVKIVVYWATSFIWDFMVRGNILEFLSVLSYFLLVQRSPSQTS